MTLIAMAIYDTEENQRTICTERTLASLLGTVDFNKHRLFLIDNGSCVQTKKLIKVFCEKVSFVHGIRNSVTVIDLTENIGTARAINQAWKHRRPGEHCIKMDNDVIIHQKNWVEDLEYCVEKSPTIGIVGLKRKDCWEHPRHEHAHLRSKLEFLPHAPGERWMAVEIVNHVMGTCQLYNSLLLDKIGFLYQPRLYGFDDSLAAQRSHFAGFENAFIPHIHIDHIDAFEDVSQDPYTAWKQQHSSEDMSAFQRIVDEYKTGKRSIYCPAEYEPA